MTLADCAGYEDLIDPTKDYGAHGPMPKAVCKSCDQPIIQSYKPYRGTVKVSTISSDNPVFAERHRISAERINSETPVMWVHTRTQERICFIPVPPIAEPKAGSVEII